MTADEAAKLNIRTEGIYPFEVADAKDATSKEKGNPMIALVLTFFDTDGSRFTVKDWLVHSENRWSEKKCYDFALTTGLSERYAAGAMTADDCLSRSGFAAIGIEKGKEKIDGSGRFPDRNKVAYYTTPPPKDHGVNATQELPPLVTAKSGDLDEDVPF